MADTASSAPINLRTSQKKPIKSRQRAAHSEMTRRRALGAERNRSESDAIALTVDVIGLSVGRLERTSQASCTAAATAAAAMHNNSV